MHRILPAGHFDFALLSAERALVARERDDLPAARMLIDDAIQIAERASQSGGSLYIPIYLTYRAEFELAANQPAPAQADLHRALDLLLTGAQP